MKTYLTYSEYMDYTDHTEYGGTASEADFNLLELRARKRIDRLTASRVQKMKKVPEAVKLCALSLIEIDHKAGAEAQINNPVVTSFNTDGYSETYGKALSVADVEKSMSATIKTLLWGETDDNGVPLLYRGVEA